MTTEAKTDHAAALARGRQLAASGVGRMIREAAGLTLAEVAAAVGDVDPSAVYRWEVGQRRPSGERATAYADLLDRLTQRNR